MSAEYEQAKERLCALLAPILQKQDGNNQVQVINKFLEDDYYSDLSTLKYLQEKMEYVILYNRFMDKSTQISADAFLMILKTYTLIKKTGKICAVEASPRSSGVSWALRRIFSRLSLSQP
jgi:hypothetical protein